MFLYFYIPYIHHKLIKITDVGIIMNGEMRINGEGEVTVGYVLHTR
jgi:hypothetical protein